MKKTIFICLIITFISCNAQEKKSIDFENISVEEFQKMIVKNGSQLIDVRTPKEYGQGHIKNARLINFFDDNFEKKAFKGLDKNQPVFVYCASGGRSAKASKMYQEAGFKKVYNLLGGFRAWSTKKLEIEK